MDESSMLLLKLTCGPAPLEGFDAKLLAAMEEASALRGRLAAAEEELATLTKQAAAKAARARGV